jgi:hypothetical protein
VGRNRVDAGAVVHGDARMLGFHVTGQSVTDRVTDREFVEDVVVGVGMRITYRLEDGPDGTASYLIDVTSGGEVVIADNVMQKGPKSENRSAAIHIAGEGTAQDFAAALS